MFTYLYHLIYRKHMSRNEQIKWFGSYKRWWAHGPLYKYCFYDENSERHGEYKEWHANGKHLKIHCFYQHGVLHGPYKQWYGDGQLMEVFFYEHGSIHGTYKYFCNTRLGIHSYFCKFKGQQHMGYHLYEQGIAV